MLLSNLSENQGISLNEIFAFRQLGIKNRHDSVMETAVLSQEHFSVNMVHRSIHKCRLKLYYAKKMPYINMIQKCRHLLWKQLRQKGKLFLGQTH